MFSNIEPASYPASVPGRQFEFTLKLRVDCPTSLWQAAAGRMRGSATSAEDVADLLGPPEDPSIEDCLMGLALPSQIPGCAMLNVFLRSAKE